MPNFVVFFCYQFFRRGGLCSTVSWDFVPARWSGVRGPAAFTVGRRVCVSCLGPAVRAARRVPACLCEKTCEYGWSGELLLVNKISSNN
jgi:hypothetical protein